MDTLNDIPNSELQLTITDQLFLDVLIMEIRKTVLGYSVKKKKWYRKGRTVRKRNSKSGIKTKQNRRRFATYHI